MQSRDDLWNSLLLLDESGFEAREADCTCHVQEPSPSSSSQKFYHIVDRHEIVAACWRLQTRSAPILTSVGWGRRSVRLERFTPHWQSLWLHLIQHFPLNSSRLLQPHYLWVGLLHLQESLFTITAPQDIWKWVSLPLEHLNASLKQRNVIVYFFKQLTKNGKGRRIHERNSKGNK